VKEDNGKRVYEVVAKGDPRYRSNHVRTAPFTWNFEFAGTDIQTVPYTVKGSAQVMIDKSKVKEALYLTESWNVLLDQALNSVTRSVVRGKVTIDMVIGAVEKELWSDTTSGQALPLVAELIYEGVLKYELQGPTGCGYAGNKLADLGIIVLKVDITDFEDELDPEERKRIRASALGRQEGRARDLTGQGIAKEQEHMAAVLAGLDPDLREAILKNRALVDAVNKGGSVETLVAALIGHLRK
jgi:regulator of protease activity HflC (stomatin/prohibitin superfamily)